MCEILAPVGSEEMLQPAVFSGADAVYLGLDAMNARRSAKGFLISELSGAVSFCHARMVKVYVTLNTVIYNGELTRAAQAIKAIAESGADAIIVQDLAVACLAKHIAPALALHGSTQMSVHSLSGAMQLAEMGFVRVILSRELTLAEIKHITAGCGIETEVFVHGALCMSISGQCYMSAFLGGRSGNRGSCAGPCRLPFSAGEKGKAHLSLKEMCHIDYLTQLAKAGVTSFKIEGRLRGAEYVAAAVNACKQSLQGQSYEKQLLQDVFSRSGFTDSYIKGVRDGEMFGTRTGEDSKAAKAAQPKLHELYRREMQKIEIKFTCLVNESGVTLTAFDGENQITCNAEIKAEKPNNDCSPAITKALEKCGGTPFFAKEIKIVGGGEFFAPSALINELRRKVLLLLLEKRQAVKPIAVTDFVLKPFTVKDKTFKGIIARFENVRQMPDDINAYSQVILPLCAESLKQPPNEKIWLELPRFMDIDTENLVIALVKEASEKVFGGFVAENIGHFNILKGQNIIGGFGLNVSNPLAAEEYTRLGAKIVTLSPELLCGEMPFVNVPAAALGYGFMPLMLTRACPLHNVQNCSNCIKEGRLLDRKGVYFTVKCKGGVRTVYNPVPLYMGDKKSALPTDYHILYFTHESGTQAQQITQNYIKGLAFEGEFTRGLYFKGTM